MNKGTKLAASVATLLVIGGFSALASASWIPFGAENGVLAVHFAGPGCPANNSACENPGNLTYANLQFSPTNTNGAEFAFASLPVPFNFIFGDVGQFGLDLTTGPSFTAYDNVDGSALNRAAAEQVVWAINDYKDGAGGPSNAANVPVNSVIRGTGINITNLVVTPIGGDNFQMDISAELLGDGIVHWYNPSFTDQPFSNYPFLDGSYLSGNLRFSTSLFYANATDTTAGLDFYSSQGPVLIEAEVLQAIPEPGTLALLGLGLAGLAMRRRKMAA